jgi:hypothetical protein
MKAAALVTVTNFVATVCAPQVVSLCCFPLQLYEFMESASSVKNYNAYLKIKKKNFKRFHLYRG